MARTARRVASVREYIASKPKASRASLEAVRRAIRKAIPNAQEGLAYQMPAYTLDGIAVLYFAGWKAHYSLYPASDALAAKFARELAPYERSKGTIKFPLAEPVPVRLIEWIAKFRARQVRARHGTSAQRKGGKESQPERIRRLCAGLPSAFEKTSHGSPWPYDTHVPIMMAGPGVKAGTYTARVSICDIAPTLSFLLRIEQPNGSVGRILSKAVGD